MKHPDPERAEMSRRTEYTRRRFLARTGATGIALTGALGSSTARSALARDDASMGSAPRGKAEHCIYLWLGGGVSQIDTWDPRPQGDPKTGRRGSYYASVSTAIRGVRVCEHLRRTADILDRFALVRTVHHDAVQEHAAAVLRMHTGRRTSGTIEYPSIGSITSHELGPGGNGIPAYVVMGYPNLTRGPGFLGAKHSYIYLTDTKVGPAALSPPRNVSLARQARRWRLLRSFGKESIGREGGDRTLADFHAVQEESFRLGNGDFMRVFDLDREPTTLREAYGGEFGQRCLLARRLIQAGVRFVEVSHNLNFINGAGWDIHQEGYVKQHLLIEELDRALSALVLDLEQQGWLDRTLIVIGTEFGRPTDFDRGGGRGHWSKNFSVALAGGGLSTGRVVGETGEFANEITARPVSVPDLFATVFQALGVHPHGDLYAGERPVPITEGGVPLRELFA